MQRRHPIIERTPLAGGRRSPASSDPILVIGPNDDFRRVLAREVESLPAPVYLANDLDQAETHAAGFERPPSIVLLPESEIEPDGFEQRLAGLRIRTGSPHLVPIAFGRSPSEARRRALRDAGVDLALFGRFGRHALRFQINRAVSPRAGRPHRGELRAPLEWRTRTFSAGRAKEVRCYTLSSGGGYFVTPRPWVVGSEIALELPIGRPRLRVRGRVLYTNAGDTGTPRGLPRGMAVGFDALDERIQDVIRRGISATQQGLRV